MQKKVVFLTVILLSAVASLAQIQGSKAWQVAEVRGDKAAFQDKISGMVSVHRHDATWLNYNPALQLKGESGGLSVPIDKADLSKHTFFIVSATADTTAEGCLWALENDGKSQIMMTTRRLADLKNFRYLNFGQGSNQLAGIRTYYGSDAEQKVAGGKQIVRIGGQPLEADLPATAFQGAIAEFLLFDRVLSGMERAQTESYLGIKYGITREGDYYDSRGNTIWDSRKNLLFSKSIAGIGRDDYWQLHQKQAFGNCPKPLLKIAADTLTKYQNDNPAQLNDRAYLLWGDNGKLPFFDETPNDSIRLLSRQWLAVTAGSITEISTALYFAPGQLAERTAPGEHYLLAIDRSGTGRFAAADTDWITAVNQSASDSVIMFSRVRWDTDGSGSDIFTLAILRKNQKTENDFPENPAVFFEAVGLWPNPAVGGDFQIAVKLRTTADLDYHITDSVGKVLHTGTLAGSDRYFFTQHLSQRGAFVLSLSNGHYQWAMPVIVP